MFVSAVGQGVMFSLAFVGAARFVCWLAGTTLSDRMAGNLFLGNSLLAGGVAGFLYVRSLNRAKAEAVAVATPDRSP